MGDVIRHDSSSQGYPMSSNQQVHRTNGGSSLFQLVTNPPVVKRAVDGVVIENFKRRENFVNGDDFHRVMATATRPVFEFRNRERRDGDAITGSKGLLATEHQSLGPLPLGGL